MSLDMVIGSQRSSKGNPIVPLATPLKFYPSPGVTPPAPFKKVQIAQSTKIFSYSSYSFVTKSGVFVSIRSFNSG